MTRTPDCSLSRAVAFSLSLGFPPSAQVRFCMWAEGGNPLRYESSSVIAFGTLGRGRLGRLGDVRWEHERRLRTESDSRAVIILLDRGRRLAVHTQFREVP